jgi:hypothetical protein
MLRSPLTPNPRKDQPHETPHPWFPKSRSPTGPRRICPTFMAKTERFAKKITLLSGLGGEEKTKREKNIRREEKRDRKQR